MSETNYVITSDMTFNTFSFFRWTFTTSIQVVLAPNKFAIIIAELRFTSSEANHGKSLVAQTNSRVSENDCIFQILSIQNRLKINRQVLFLILPRFINKYPPRGKMHCLRNDEKEQCEQRFARLLLWCIGGMRMNEFIVVRLSGRSLC